MVRTERGVKLSDVAQGDSPTYSYTIKDGDGNAKDITGYEVHMYIKEDRNDDDSDALIKKNNAGDGGGSITDAANGEAEFDLSSSDTQNLEGEKYWRVYVVKSSGDQHTTHTGDINFFEA
jgi:hypothetical protein